MNHPQRFKIIGFCDAAEKKHGTDDCTHFREEDCVTSDHIPNQTELRLWAADRGYWPSGKRGSNPDRCEPVYLLIGEGLDYLKCPICWPSRAVIDNQKVKQS